MNNEVDIIRRWIDSKELARDLDIRLSVACDQFELGDMFYNDLYEVMAVLRYEEHRRGLEEGEIDPWDYIKRDAWLKGISIPEAIKEYKEND